MDSGKTSLARELTEIVSTSGLDAHPQSKERGITIDLGFTSFIEKDALITLVDAPGHADLIRSVVASGRIIDGAIIVIDGKEGIQVQTAEHMVILELLHISQVIFVINKIDLINPEQVQHVKTQLKSLLKNTIFDENSPIIEISAKKGTGFDVLKQEILKLEKTPTASEDFLVYPIDHHFQKKGIGLVVTGTTQGSFSVGDSLTVIPHFVDVKVKNAQVYHQNVQKVPSGFRAGLILSGIESDKLQRGDIITNTPNRFEKGELLEVVFTFSKHFQRSIKFGSQINVTLGMVTTTARFFPFYMEKNVRIMVNEVSIQKIKHWTEEKAEFGAYIWFQVPHYLNTEEIIILSQLDLPPSTLRFFGSARIRSILPTHQKPEVYHMKIKNGKITNPQYSNTSILVEGLAKSKEGAQTLLKKSLEPPFGKILNLFGGKGVVIVEKPKDFPCEIGDPVILKTQRSVKINRDKSYT